VAFEFYYTKSSGYMALFWQIPERASYNQLNRVLLLVGCIANKFVWTLSDQMRTANSAFDGFESKRGFEKGQKRGKSGTQNKSANHDSTT